mmetsp:Transcript_12578/g.36632  ORF Transcript_12578/g.36632 Transcript_12578/m.36632 type:complete len:263 (-) Transcript_12578:903-1691(-)
MPPIRPRNPECEDGIDDGATREGIMALRGRNGPTNTGRPRRRHEASFLPSIMMLTMIGEDHQRNDGEDLPQEQRAVFHAFLLSLQQTLLRAHQEHRHDSTRTTTMVGAEEFFDDSDLLLGDRVRLAAASILNADRVAREATSIMLGQDDDFLEESIPGGHPHDHRRSSEGQDVVTSQILNAVLLGGTSTTTHDEEVEDPPHHADPLVSGRMHSSSSSPCPPSRNSHPHHPHDLMAVDVRSVLDLVLNDRITHLFEDEDDDDR